MKNYEENIVEIPPGVAIQVIIAVAGVASIVVASRVAASNASKDYEELHVRVGDLEKTHMGKITYRDADDRYVGRREFDITIKNIDGKLGHIEKAQSDMLKILQKGN